MTEHNLTEKDVQDLAWVADVLDSDDRRVVVTQWQYKDLAGVIRSKLPEPPKPKKVAHAVKDKYGTMFFRFAGGWYYVKGTQALRVPFSSIQEPVFQDTSLELVE